MQFWEVIQKLKIFLNSSLELKYVHEVRDEKGN